MKTGICSLCRRSAIAVACLCGATTAQATAAFGYASMSTTGAVQNFIEATQRTFHSAPAIRAPFQQDDRIFRSCAGTRMGASPVMPVRLRIDENPSVTCLYVDNRARTARGAAIDYVTGMKVTHDRNRVHVEYLVAHEVRSSPCNTWIYEDQGTGRGAGYLPVAANVADGPGFGPRATQVWPRSRDR